MFLTDKDLGEIAVQTNARARRLTFRMKEGRMQVTVPPGTGMNEVRRAVEELRPRLLAVYRAGTPRAIGWDYRIDTEFFKFSLVAGGESRFLLRMDEDGTHVVCPPHTDFAAWETQAWLRRVVVEAMRRRARAVLPERLAGLSRRHGLPYRQVKINAGQSRWGSCSSGGNINLSCYLVLLPARLVDYVLLHELAHTREMNHSACFWALLDSMAEGRALALREEMKQYRAELPGG